MAFPKQIEYLIVLYRQTEPDCASLNDEKIIAKHKLMYLSTREASVRIGALKKTIDYLNGKTIEFDRPATPAQIDYCKKLFRKVKLYYNCLDDDELVRRVRERTGFDLTSLPFSDAQRIINKLTTELKRSPRYQARQPE